MGGRLRVRAKLVRASYGEGVEVTSEALARFFEVSLPHLNEVQRRVVAGAASQMLILIYRRLTSMGRGLREPNPRAERHP